MSTFENGMQRASSAPAGRTVGMWDGGQRTPAKPAQTKQTSDSLPQVGLSLLWHTFVQWWKVAVPFGLVLAAISGAVVLWKFEPRYRADALIEIKDVVPFIAFSNGNNEQAGRRYVETQVELMRSRLVLEPLLREPDVASVPELYHSSDALKYLQRELNVERVGNSELHMVTFTSFQPAGARDVVNAVVKQYLRVQQEDEQLRTERVIDSLDREKTKLKFEVDALRRQVLERAQEATGNHHPGSKRAAPDGEAALSPLASLQQLLIQTDVAREQLRAELEARKEMPRRVDPSKVGLLPIEMAVASHSEVLRAQTEVNQVQAELEAHKSTSAAVYRRQEHWRPDSTYNSLARLLESRKQQLDELRNQVRSQLQFERARSNVAEQDQTILELGQRLAMAEKSYNHLKERFDQELEKVKKGGAQSVQLDFAMAELDRQERVLDMIAERKLALQTEARAPDRVRPRRDAVLPTVPVEPLPFKKLLLVCLASFLAPFALCVCCELLIHRVNDVEQFGEKLRLPVVGEIAKYPVVPVGPDENEWSDRANRELAVVGECFDSLRVTLALMNQMPSPCVIAVTSAAPGEGKSTVSTKLALSIARALRKPTLLIDGDLRSPDIHRMLGTPRSLGVSDVLRHQCRLEDAIHKANGSGMHVMPAGSLRGGSPHDFVLADEVRNLLELLKPTFDYIVIDLPPVLSASESLVFACQADSVLFCSMRDVSRVSQVQAALARLNRAGANVIGGVLSGTPIRTYLSRYGCYRYFDDREVDDMPASAELNS